MSKSSDNIITAVAPWFGGKRTLAADILAEVGPHSAWWNLCCGSLALELAKPPAAMETAVDLHGDLTNLAFVLQRRELAEDLYDRLARTLCSRELCQASQALCKSSPPAGDDPPDVERAYHYMVASWLGRNGTAGTRDYNHSFCVRYTRLGGHAATRFRSATESIPAWHERLRSLTILRADLFAVVERIEDAAGVVIYVDPPYVDKGALYVHDFSRDDHRRLATALARFRRTRVVVSCYDHPLMRDLYQDWTWRRLEANKALVSAGMRDQGGPVAAPEVLLINGPSLVESADRVCLSDR